MARKTKKDPTPLQRWATTVRAATTSEAARPTHPPQPTDKEWREFLRDLRRLGELCAERQTEIRRLEELLAETRKEADRFERESKALRESSVDDAGWRRLHELAREARADALGRALEDWLEDWAPACHH